MTITLNASTSSGLVVTPDNSGNIVLQYNGVAAPAFSAYATTSQTITYNSETKITLGTEVFDTANCFASSRFTPTVAGYYQLNGQACLQSTSYGLFTAIYKNGSVYVYGSVNPGLSGAFVRSVVSSIVYLNGTTDYVELYAAGTGGGSGAVGVNPGPADTWFNGCLLRGA
jgi:hypothetical protein